VVDESAFHIRAEPSLVAPFLFGLLRHQIGEYGGQMEPEADQGLRQAEELFPVG
jgi:hypothetical protein